MNKVKVLVEGYAQEHEDFEKVSPSVVLIETDRFKIIVDPGFNRKELLDSLERENLRTDQIDFVILTHTHLDHSILAGIFENAVILDSGDQFLQNGIIKRQENSMFEGIEIIPTPGHDQFHCSILIKTENMGNILIAGDVFWWLDAYEPEKDFESLLNLDDPYMKDKVALIESRKKILEISDYIIPGHGKMFKVEKQKIS